MEECTLVHTDVFVGDGVDGGKEKKKAEKQV